MTGVNCLREPLCHQMFWVTKNERKQMEYYNGHSKLCQPTSKDLKMEEEVIEEGQNITTSSTITLGEK